MPKLVLRKASSLVVIAAGVALNIEAQSIQPAYPATEYVRMNGQILAVEHPGLPTASYPGQPFTREHHAWTWAATVL